MVDVIDIIILYIVFGFAVGLVMLYIEKKENNE
jgi:hypothetical protein